MLLSKLKMTQVWVSNFWSRFECVWELHCYPGSIIPRVCGAALLFPQHSEQVRPSPITLSVCLQAKLLNRCHWTVGGCIGPHLPPEAIHSSPQQQLEHSTVLKTTAAFPLLHKHISKHTHTHHSIIHCTSMSQIQQWKVIMMRGHLWQWGGGSVIIHVMIYVITHYISSIWGIITGKALAQVWWLFAKGKYITGIYSITVVRGMEMCLCFCDENPGFVSQTGYFMFYSSGRWSVLLAGVWTDHTVFPFLLTTYRLHCNSQLHGNNSLCCQGAVRTQHVNVLCFLLIQCSVLYGKSTRLTNKN